MSPLLAAIVLSLTAAPAEQRYDIVVYGGTASGVVAAIEAARLGKTVAIVEPGQHLGGLTAGGLGATDTGNERSIGGLAREFYRRVGRHYGEAETWRFEPHVAEQTFDEWLAEARVPVLRGQRLVYRTGVVRDGPRIAELRLESGLVVRGQMFIDATYEGDLLAWAGVSYHVGRESNDVYGETLNGAQPHRNKHQFQLAIDPFVRPGDPASGLLPLIQAEAPGPLGSGDRRVQAYNFRLCLTDDPANQLPFPRPADYDPARYELLLRYIQAGVFDALGSLGPIPHRKTDTNNNGAISTDYIGANYDYPAGDYATRERIVRDHASYQQGLFWFLAHDERLPEEVRRQVNRWGLARDEFVDNGGWPHQLYVREARRMQADVVMTEHHCRGRQIVADGVGLASYGMDSHNVVRYVEAGRVWNEGDVQVHGFPPYPVAYRAIVPPSGECENLLVPVCLSASHIAYGSIRMEPVFMILGHSAAAAAAQAIDEGASVQRIDVPKLQARLAAEGQVLRWQKQ